MHRLVNAFLWQLFPDGRHGRLSTHQSSQALTGVYGTFPAWHHRYDSQDVQWVQSWKVSMNPRHFYMCSNAEKLGVFFWFKQHNFVICRYN